MANKSKRALLAVEKAKKVFDKILDVYEARDFVEVTARVGGDVIVRRYYDNGMETDR